MGLRYKKDPLQTRAKRHNKKTSLERELRPGSTVLRGHLGVSSAQIYESFI